MSYYTGEECLICKNKFTEEDDVIVCPECGTPYHRACYNNKKQCVNEALHRTHGSWMAESIAMKNKSDSDDAKICMRCLSMNKKDAEVCIKCGKKLTSDENGFSDIRIDKTNPDSTDDYFGFDISETMDENGEITLGEMADYVKSNKLFYILSFKRLKNASAKISLNIFAFFFPEYYFAIRKMYFWAGVVLILKYLTGIPLILSNIAELNLINRVAVGYIKENLSNPVFLSLSEYFRLVLKVIAGIAANELYYRHILKKLKKLRTDYPDNIKYRAKIKETGGISLVSMFILLLSNVLFSILFLLFTMLIIQ